jgi:(S)-sulfolactate dehydrogenase
MTARIVISEFMDAPAVERLGARFDVDYRPGLVDEPAALAAALEGARAWIVRNRTQVRGAALEAARALRVVGRLGVGLDNIDVPACESRGIEVIAATGANAESVAEYVVTTALVLLRGAYFSTAAVEAGAWPRPALSQGREASGKVMGLVGFGGIGRLAARKAMALGMKVVGYDPLVAASDPAWRESSTTPMPLPEVLAASDVVSLHIPLTPDTRGLRGAVRLGLM